jgi:hypothetical protein
VLQGQADRVDRLDNPVVQIHTNAFPLFQHGQAAALDVETYILDGRPGPRSNRSQELELHFIEWFGGRSGHGQHPQRAAAAGKGKTGNLPDAGFDHGFAQVAPVGARDLDDHRLGQFGSFTNGAFSFGEAIARP